MLTTLIRELVDSGVHFGHRVSWWNPKMAPYIYGKRNGIHIINVKETVKGLLMAKKFVTQTVAQGRDLLFVGTIEPRKNLGRLLSAFETIRSKGLADGLVIAGQRGWLYDAFFTHLEESPARDGVILPGYVPDEDLPALYGGALALVFPSIHEGFGLPVLEAMGCGVPVATSNTSSLPEIGGDAAQYFDPLDVASISATLCRLLGDTELQDEMRSRGLARAAAFSWERAAAETRAVYDAVLTGT